VYGKSWEQRTAHTVTAAHCTLVYKVMLSVDRTSN